MMKDQDPELELTVFERLVLALPSMLSHLQS